MARKDEDDNREPGDDDNIGHGDLSAATKMPSRLIRHTLKKFAWGVVSAQEAQQIAECSKKDFDNFIFSFIIRFKEGISEARYYPSH